MKPFQSSDLSERESMLMLTETSGFTIPVMPPEFHDHGKPIISTLLRLGWLNDVRARY